VIGGETGLSVQPGADCDGRPPQAARPAGGSSQCWRNTFDGNAFVAVGAAAQSPSTDAAQWTRDDSGTTTDLHAIATQHTLIAGGSVPILSSTSSPLAPPRTRPSDSILDLAASDTAASRWEATHDLRSAATPLHDDVEAPVDVTKPRGAASSRFARAAAAADVSVFPDGGDAAAKRTLRDSRAALVASRGYT